MQGLGKIYSSLGLEDKISIQVRSLCAVSRMNSLPSEEEKEAGDPEKSWHSCFLQPLAVFLPVPREEVRGKGTVRSSGQAQSAFNLFL